GATQPAGEVGVRQRGQRLHLGAELADPITDPIAFDRGTTVEGDVRGECNQSVNGQPQLDDRSAHAGTFMPQRGVRDRPALPWLSDYGVGRHLDGIEEDLVEIRGAGQLAQWADRDARAGHVEDERTDALVLGG